MSLVSVPRYALFSVRKACNVYCERKKEQGLGHSPSHISTWIGTRQTGPHDAIPFNLETGKAKTKSPSAGPCPVLSRCVYCPVALTLLGAWHCIVPVRVGAVDNGVRRYFGGRQ